MKSRALATSLLFAVTLYAAAPARQVPNGAPGAQAHTIAPKLTLKGVPRFGQVTPTLYRGGQPTRQGFEGLARLGINIVVDARGSRASERQLVTRLGMQYVPIPWRCLFPKDETFARFLKLLRDNPGKKVFVHCRIGDDRTGLMIATYRMAEQGWTAQEAADEMGAYGVNWLHYMICPGQMHYEQNFPQRFRTSPVFQDLRSTPSPPQP